MRQGLATGVVLVLACAALPACRLLEDPPDRPAPLPLARVSEETVSLELFFARLPPVEAATIANLWTDIDEQQIPAGLRRQLELNGIRAGFVSGAPPASLTKLLESAQPPPAPGERRLPDDDPRPLVTRRIVQMRSGRRSDVVISPAAMRMAVLFPEEGRVRGRTYEDAQAQFGLKASSQGDGRVKLELTPELLHGAARPHYVGEDGVFRLDASRPKEIFDKLTLATALAAGEILIVGPVPERPGSLGHHFFTEENGGRREQKLLLVRVAKHQKDDLFEPPPAK